MIVLLAVLGGICLLLLGGVLLLWRQVDGLRQKLQAADRSLDEQGRRLRLLAQNSRDLIYQYRLKPTPGFEYVSPSATEMVGYTPDEHYANPNLGFELVHPDDRHLLEQVANGQGDEPLVLRWRHKDGRVLWTEQLNTPLLDEKGAVVGIQGIARDVTKRKLAEDRLREREAHYRALVDWTDDMIFTLDREGRLMAVNQRMRDLYGWTDEVIGRSMEAIFGPERLRDFSQQRLAVLQTGQPRKFEWRSVHFEKAWYAVNLNPILDDNGQVRAVSGVARIITNEKKILEEYEHLISDLERFTYTISHDLRSPLITIQGFLGILEQDLLAGKAEEVQRDMARIRQATGHMEDLLDQLLELARVGRVVLHLQPVNLGEVAALACAAQQVELDKRNITVSLAEDLPLVKADPVRLREVLDNLLSNAIRFMGNPAQPAIEIGCQVQHDETVCFVRDNGIGIDLRYHQKIFGLFEQLDAHSEGTGIGLALVKRIIELHNGRIWVESDGPDTGSTFYFTLPQD